MTTTSTTTAGTARSTGLADPRFARMLREDRHDNPDTFIFAANQLFDGVPLAGKRVLEIGSGRGLLSLYLALRGARVTSLEPEMAGSTSGTLAIQQARCQELGLSVECVNADFNDWHDPRDFDIVLMRSVINHLYPTTKHARWDKATWDGNVTMLGLVRNKLAPGGVFVAYDASRWGFFLMARNYVRQPWKKVRTSVNWRHHQNALTWAKMLKAVGFSHVERDYTVPYPMRSISFLLRNGFASFWLKGAFVIRAR